MIDSGVTRVRNSVLLISVAAWILLVAAPERIVAHCATAGSGTTSLPSSFQMLLAMNPPSSLAAGWALMLVAMMSPMLILPIHYLRLRSFSHRRARSTVLFVAGYAAIWMMLGC